MDHARLTFYIIASIALGLFAVFQIVAIAVLLSIRRKIARAGRTFSFIAREMHGLIQAGKSYSRYLGARAAGSILGKILNIISW